MSRQDEPRPLHGPVRIGYFDPRTGEPCDTKPKPLTREEFEAIYGKPPAGRHELDKSREAIAEGAAILARMEARRKEQAKERVKAMNAARKRPVMVDGVRYESVTAAAEAMGCEVNYLGKRLRAKAGMLKGRKVWFAGEEEPAARKRKRSGHVKAVIVDGVRYPSVKVAAAETGILASTLSYALSSGRTACKGRSIAYAKEES